MNAFATAMSHIFGHADMAVDALWFAGGLGPGVAIRVIRKSPDEITQFGAARILSETTVLDARVADLPTPAAGDLRIPRKMGIDSTRRRALIPRHRGQPFHGIAGS